MDSVEGMDIGSTFFSSHLFTRIGVFVGKLAKVRVLYCDCNILVIHYAGEGSEM